jgi:predicted nuclease of restriction endonuclease-like (RecB) superfamily
LTSFCKTKVQQAPPCHKTGAVQFLALSKIQRDIGSCLDEAKIGQIKISLMATNLAQLGDYNDFLKSLKERIRTAQVRAALAVNRELVLLYWQIGQDILIRQQQQGWGTKVIDQLAKDLKHEFPDMKGFSSRNLKYMRAFAEAYPDEPIVQQAVAQIPWGHNVRILDYVKAPAERLWYIQQTIEYGWSRNVLVHHIETKLYQRQGQATTNFEQSLPKPQSDLAQQLLKDPYNFDFLSLGQAAQERDLERALIDNIRSFLLELGVGFAFVGSQYHLEVGGDDFYIDMLFYHLKLRCYVVIDLKMTAFKPDYSGKMNFYISAVDDMLRHSDDLPTIGIILCRGKNKTVAEYALRDINKPMGVSAYHLKDVLPEGLEESLPAIAQLEKVLDTVVIDPEPKTSD